jgi:hypothetical protein
MSVVRMLIGLYPAPFRDQWGRDLEVEARAAGWRGWPNLLVGALNLWLHPAVWPAESPARRRRRAAALAVSVTAVVWFLFYAITELDGRANRWAVTASIPTCCAALILLGLVLVSPLPEPSLRAGVMLLRRGLRHLAGPVGLGVLLLAWAFGAVPGGEHSALQPPLIAAWWFAVALGAVGLCRAFISLDPELVTPPSATRLRVGIVVLTVGAVLTGVALLRFALVSEGIDVPSAIAGTALLLLSAAFPATLHDLNQLPAADPP